jgi:hypothetical protein
MPSPHRTTLRGRLIDPSTRLGIEGVRVDVWDKEQKATIAVAWTDEEGLFSARLPNLPEEHSETHQIRQSNAVAHAAPTPLTGHLRPFPVSDREPRVALAGHYELLLADTLVSAKAESVERRADGFDAVLSGTRRPGHLGRIEVDSWHALLEHEHEIVARINRLQNGGQLFLIHPFLTLAEVGVVLAPKARAEIVAREPSLRSLSAVPFHALRTSEAKQKVRVKIRGLFRRES